MSAETPRPWRRVGSEPGPDLIIARARFDTLEHPLTGDPHRRLVLDAPSWVNVVARTVGGAFVVLWAIFALVVPFLGGKGGSFPVLWMLGLGLAAVGTILPRVLKPVYYAWMTFAILLGWVMTRVLLTIFFFLVLMPTGIIMRLVGRDPMQRKIDQAAETYWIDKEYPIKDRSRLEKFF